MPRVAAGEIVDRKGEGSVGMITPHENPPSVGSLWVDTENGYFYQYRGICEDEPFEGMLAFGRWDTKTQTVETVGGLHIGMQRFVQDMRPIAELDKHPCCGQPTLYPILWCDDCGYDAWEKAGEGR